MSNNSGDQTQHIGSAIRKLLDRFQLTKKFDETNLIVSWERLVGKPIARHTTRLYIRDKVLFIQLDSPGLKHDLNYSKSAILEVLEAEFGKGIVKEIVLM